MQLRRPEELDRPAAVQLVSVIGLLVVFAFYLRSAAVRDQVDFGVYRAGGHAVLHGHDLYALRVPVADRVLSGAPYVGGGGR